MKGATSAFILSSAIAHAAQFEVVPLPPISYDFTPEEQAGIDRSLVAIPARQLPPATPLPRIPWLQGDGDFWSDHDPLFDFADFNSGNRTLGWLALTDDHFLVHVEVDDQEHHNDLAGKEIRRADSLWVLFDAWGDDKRARPSMQARSRTDWNAHFVTALAQGKSQCRRENPVGDRTASHGPSTVGKARREGRQTIYDLRIPWKDFGVVPGVVLHSSLAIRVHDSRNAEDIFSHGTQWGGGGLKDDHLTWNGIFTASHLPTLQRVHFDPPTEPRAWATVTKRHFRQDSDYGEIVVCTNMRGPLFAEVKAGSERRGLLLQDDNPNLKWRRYAIRCMQTLNPNAKPIPFSVNVQNQTGKIASAQTELVAVHGTASRLTAALQPRINQHADNKLLQAHFKGLETANRLAWTHHGRQERRDLNLLSRTPSDFNSEGKSLIESLAGPLAEWPTYRDRRAALTIATSTPDHQSGGVCEVWLPREFDSAKTYPAYLWVQRIEPHSDLRRRTESYYKFLIAEGKGLVMKCDLSRSQNASEGITNSILVLNHLLTQLPIDPNRLFLWGDSSAVCAIAAAQPDKFAALASFSGNWNNIFLGEEWDHYQQEQSARRWFKLAGSDASRNRTQLPIHYFIARGVNPDALLWHERLFNPRMGQLRGDDQTLRPTWIANDRTLIIDTWDRAGENSKEQFQGLSNWWQKKKRTRPAEIFYLKIHDIQVPTWGVSMERNENWHAYRAETWPRFECLIEGQIVRLATYNCDHAAIDLGPSGLQMKGEVILLWNGAKVHEGPIPPQAVKLK